MTSAVKICSDALLMLGDKPISSFDEGTDRATLAANLFEPVRDYVLRSHPWNCATKRVILNPEATAPAFDYAYQFVIPGDWMRTLQVGYYGQEVDYKQEGRRLLSDESALPLRYIFKNENVASWDSMLIFAMTNCMRQVFAYGVTQSTSLEQLLSAALEPILQKARAVDGQDEPPETLGDERLFNARFSGVPILGR